MELLVYIIIYVLIVLLNIILIKFNKELYNNDKMHFAGISFIPGFNIVILIIVIVLYIEIFLKWFFGIG